MNSDARACRRMASQSTSRTSHIASAINSLFQLEEGDQASLIDVIQDYFTMPSGGSSCELSESDSDSEADVAGKCIKNNNSKITMYHGLQSLKHIARKARKRRLRRESS